MVAPAYNVLTPELARSILNAWRRSKRRGVSEDDFVADWNKSNPQIQVGNTFGPFVRPLCTRDLSDFKAAIAIHKRRGGGGTG